MTKPNIPFIDLLAQRRRLGLRIDRAVMSAVDAGQWIMGPQVKELERQLADYCGASHCLSNANGTDAIALALMAWGIGPDDAVFCPSFTFCATAEVVPWTGATPVFVDVEMDTFNMSPSHLEAAIQSTITQGKLKPKVVIGVCLFGQPANYPELAQIAKKYNLRLIADSAQGFGGTIDSAHPIKWADAVTTSFFPAKPLGCYGDGGATLCNDAAMAESIDSFRVHGKATPSDVASRKFDHDPKYLNMRIGMNSRLDTVQAAILLEKLAVFDDEIAMRNQVAQRYSAGLTDCVQVPVLRKGYKSTWAQYTIRLDGRDGLVEHLKSRGIPTAVYYPIPLHRQFAYERFPVGPGGLPVTEQLAQEVVSLPMHPDFDAPTQDFVISSIRQFVGA